jgi:hypothetical protein
MKISREEYLWQLSQQLCSGVLNGIVRMVRWILA